MDEFSIILQAKLTDADCMEITHLLNEAYHRGRADAIEELRPFIHKNVKGNNFIFVCAEDYKNLDLFEQLKEQNNE